MRLSRLLFLVVCSACVYVATLCSAQTVTNVYSFDAEHGLADPDYGALAQGRNGLLYGTAGGYGSYTGGAVFRYNLAEGVTALHTFSSTSDGAAPSGGLTLSTDGNFYGIAGGGISQSGVVFRIARNGTYTVLHQFNGDGAYPNAAPIEGRDNNLYGTTEWNTNLTGGYGTIYKYTPSGVFSTIYNFDSTHGANPLSPVIQAADGNLYGTTVGGGTFNCGTIFKITTSGVLLHSYSFQGGATGCYPVGSLMQGTDGNLYGTTFGDGTSADFGTIFQVSKSGGMSVLYRFLGGPADGANPVDGLVQATDGNLYGTTREGGTYGDGTIFQITVGGTYTLLYSFSSDVGANPYAAPSQHTDGLLYGTATAGGSSGNGTLYRLDMGLGPFITFVQSTGKVGRAAQILGQGLAGTTGVTFNGVLATTFRVVSDTYLTVVVPSGATTGPVVVTTTTGTFTSNKNFVVK